MRRQAAQRAADLVHPRDWRNIPQCLVDMSASLIERVAHLEIGQKQLTSTLDDKITQVTHQLDGMQKTLALSVSQMQEEINQATGKFQEQSEAIQQTQAKMKAT